VGGLPQTTIKAMEWFGHPQVLHSIILAWYHINVHYEIKILKMRERE
jgi:hypothetical protein